MDEQEDTIPARLSAIDDKLYCGEKRMEAIEAELMETRGAMERLAISTKDIVEAFEAMQGAFKVFDWVGRLAKPLGYIVAAAAAIYGFWLTLKGGGK